MLMTMPKFEYFSARSIEDACSLLSEHGKGSRVLAGGTDLLVKMKHKKARPSVLIDIKKIPDMGYIQQEEGGGLRIGALTTIQAIRNSPVIKKHFSVLHQAASVLGTRQVRNLATIGGNLCNASPAAETAPALLSLEAKVEIAGPEGRRTIPVEEFFLGPDKHALKEQEILTGIQIPPPPERGKGVYLKHSTRRVDVAIVGLGMLAALEDQVCRDVRIALSSVGPTPMRTRKAEEVLLGQSLDRKLAEKAARVASEESVPIDDLRGEADYRKQMVKTLMMEAIKRVAGAVWLK